MLTKDIAATFTRKWIEAFNSHKLEVILEHYAEDIEFYSPFIPLLKFNDEGIIRNKAELKRYFEIGLHTYPDLHFTLHNYFVGINTIVIYYTSVNSRMAAETYQLNEQGKAIKVYCHYTMEPSV